MNKKLFQIISFVVTIVFIYLTLGFTQGYVNCDCAWNTVLDYLIYSLPIISATGLYFINGYLFKKNKKIFDIIVYALLYNIIATFFLVVALWHIEGFFTK